MGIKKKDTDYFEYFRISAEFATKAAVFLDEKLRAFGSDGFQKKHVEEMHEIEHAADANRHEVIEKLAKEFIPPIEREDIVELAQDLDNVVDKIDELAQFIYMFDVAEIRPDALVFSELIIRCTNALLDAMVEFRRFRNSKTLKDLLITVNTLESEGDNLYSDCVRRLFLDTVDPKTTIAWMKLYDRFEDCLDACEDAVDVIESVIMKNS